MNYSNKISELESRNKELEHKCDNIYDQLTELRTKIQDIYGDMSKNERFLCHEMLKISERIEKLAKEIDPHNTNINVSPSINQTSSINNSIYDTPTPSKEKENILQKSFNFNSKSILMIIFFSLVGFFAIVGFIVVTIFQILM